MKKRIINKLIVFLLILVTVLLSVYFIIRLNVSKSEAVDRIARGEQKSLAEVTYEKLTSKDKIDKQKFEKVYRAAKTLTATIEGGISYLKLQELNQGFLTEISIAEDSVITGKEKEVIELYKTAYETYKICEAVWRAIIKYNLDNYGHQYPGQAKSIFETLKPIIEQFRLVLIPKESKYSGLMHELHTSELSKIWVVANEYIDKANAIVIGKTPN